MMKFINWNILISLIFCVIKFENCQSIIAKREDNAIQGLPELNELEYYTSSPDEGNYLFGESDVNDNYFIDEERDDSFKEDDGGVESAVGKGLMDSVQDALGIPKVTFKLPFLKGFALAAKVLPEKKKDSEDNPDANSPNLELLNSFRQSIKNSYPGTLWCSDGNFFRVIKDYGHFYKANECCKNHDKCPMKIESGQVWNQLKNVGIHERYQCDCDRQFFNCLKKVNTVISNKIGYTYFNILKPQCFRLDYPIMGCTKKLHNNCLTYIVDDTKNQTWQWFDNKFY